MENHGVIIHTVDGVGLIGVLPPILRDWDDFKLSGGTIEAGEEIGTPFRWGKWSNEVYVDVDKESKIAKKISIHDRILYVSNNECPSKGSV